MATHRQSLIATRFCTSFVFFLLKALMFAYVLVLGSFKALHVWEVKALFGK